MLELNTIEDHAVFLAIAAIGGGFGGVIYELLQQRGQHTGGLAIPRRHTGFLDLGWGASVLIGLAAAVIVLYLLAPITERTDPEGDVTRTYDLIKLIALAVVSGSAGPSVISATQARVVAALEAQRAEDTADVADRALADGEAALASAAEAAAPLEGQQSGLSAARQRLAAGRQSISALRRN